MNSVTKQRYAIEIGIYFDILIDIEDEYVQYYENVKEKECKLVRQSHYKMVGYGLDYLHLIFFSKNVNFLLHIFSTQVSQTLFTHKPMQFNNITGKSNCLHKMKGLILTSLL